MSVARQGISNGVHHTRCRANRAKFADTFHAKHIVGAWDGLIGVGLEHLGHDVCARRGIVHQAAGDQLTTLCVIDQAF